MALELVLALSFLSRIAPARVASEAEMAASVKWYPVAGVIIGLILALPFALGLGAGKPLLQGIAFSCFYLWLTRALHWDGLADLFDALGSGRHGEEFSAVMKDSRIGVFGVVAVAAGLLAFSVGAVYTLEFGRWPVLVWAVVMGRSVVCPLAALAAPNEQGSLGRIVHAGSGGVALYFSLALALLCGIICVGFWATLMVVAVVSAIIWQISRVAVRDGGLSGDYFGAAIVLTEICTLIICAWLY